MNAIRNSYLLLACCILIGHSLVPHSHDEIEEDYAVHQHKNQHQSLADLLVCFFHVDHESEDFENYFTSDLSFDTPSSYAVIPVVYSPQRNSDYTPAVPESPQDKSILSRGPPAV